MRAKRGGQRRPAFTVALALCFGTGVAGAGEPGGRWAQLPPLPDKLGVAGPFVGVSRGALLVGGGANFPQGMPWDGGKKVWHDELYVLTRPDGVWQGGYQLPQPNGYGVTITSGNAIICLGGGDALTNFATAFRLEWKRGAVWHTDLPAMPRTVAMMSGALAGKTIYVAGGLERPDATNTLHTFWALNLAKAHPQWEELPAWPGPARMLAVAAADNDSFYLFSGADLQAGPNGKPVRNYLTDAYRYQPKKGWQRLADLPRAAVAAPSPAPWVDKQFLIASGDDGTQVNFEPKTLHPGFPKTVLAYDPRRNTWTETAGGPFSRATTTTVTWQGRYIVPSGELRPGVRTPEVWTVDK